jgi:peptidoglycan biosynthesis protein MviN/MurJ (putative lipid II flippase)
LGLGCVLLIRPLGIEGAALSVLLSNIVNVIYLVIVLKRYLQISLVFLFRMAYLKPIMLGFVLAGLSYLLRPLAGTWSGFILVGIALEIFFVGVGYLIGIFGETEKRAILGLRHMVFKSHKY